MSREEKIKKIIIISIFLFILIVVIALGLIYYFNQKFRRWVDISIMQKSINTEDIVSIDLDTNKNNQIYCYNKYICILSEKNLKLYNSAGLNISEITTNINTAIFNSYDKYLVIAEKNGQDFCAIYDKQLLFSERIERRDTKYLCK